MATVLLSQTWPPNEMAVAIDQLAWEDCELRAAEIERRLLEGENRIELIRPTGGTIVYQVPRWGEHPIRRFRIALARWKERRKHDR